MKVLVIVAHPNLETSKINKAWIMELQKRNDITVNSLYENYPDGNIEVAREQVLLLDHDRIVFQFPFYWYSAPHLLHYWQEQVLTFGWAYGPGGTRLAGKQFMVAVSTGGPADAYQAGGYNNFSMSELLKPFQQMTNLLGGKYLAPFILHGVRTLSSAEVETSAQKYVERLLS